MTYFSEETVRKRPPIIKGLGVTPSERYLAKLAEKSFLSLWSYPNPFRNQKAGVGSNGKELCDLLVVCGKHIIIFSEKNIGWKEKEIKVAWSNWYKKAVHNAVKQIRGAERWIKEFPEQIFLDPNCSVPFPINFPAPNDRIIHRIVVARGAGEACKKYFKGGIGSLAIKPSITGDRHWNTTKFDDVKPFLIGDVNPDETFVHILDDATLDLLMSEFDTISDFTEYLQKKAEFFRSGRLGAAHGEEDLVAYYSTRTNGDGDHDFHPMPEDNWDGIEPVEFDGSSYKSLLENPRYVLKKQADENSYVWDTLIELFAEHMLGGTSVSPPGMDFSLKQSEIGIRHMAMQPRILRRNFGNAILDAMKIGSNEERFIRAMIGPAGGKYSETGFFFLTLSWLKDRFSYEDYRLMRSGTAKVYAHGLLVKYSHLKRIVGIAVDASTGGTGGSEDLIYMEQADWSEDAIAKLKKECEELNILQSGLTVQLKSEEEYPSAPGVFVYPNSSSAGLNRKQRRAALSRKRKK